MATELFLIGLFVGMGGSGAIALAALTYPTAIRSTGVGWAMAMGRFGQVIAPLCAGLAVKGGWMEQRPAVRRACDRTGAGRARHLCAARCSDAGRRNRRGRGGKSARIVSGKVARR